MKKTALHQLLSQATSLYHSGDYQEAIQVWEQILQDEPKNQQAQEGIKMASLLLEEAQAAADAAGAKGMGADQGEEDPRVQAGIQQVREFLGESRYIEAIEVCRSLLSLAPGSGAIREILEEARDAYESQPFITEHLEIARQLFVQERFDEALGECQKIFFLNPNHEVARRLHTKIDALKKKRAGTGISAAPSSAGGPETPAASPGTDPIGGVAVPGEPGLSDEKAIGESTVELAPDLPPLDGPEGEEPGPTPEPMPTEEMAPGSAALPDPDPSMPQGPRDEMAGAAASAVGETPGQEIPGDEVLNEDWEKELSQLDLGPTVVGEEARTPIETSPAPDSDDPPLVDLSESLPPAPVEGGEVAAGSAPEEIPGLDFDLDSAEMATPSDAGTGSPDHPPESVPPPNSSERRPPSASPKSSGRRWLRLGAPVLLLGLLGGAAYWYFFLHPLAASGQSSSGSPPSLTPPSSVSGVEITDPASAEQANPGISGSTRAGHRAAPGESDASSGGAVDSAGVIAGSTEPENPQAAIDRLWSEAGSRMDAGDHRRAAELLARLLELDSANIRAKSMLDEAIKAIQEADRIQEDFRVARQYFEEQDYESALKKFYRLPRDRGLGDINLYLRNSWYNWGLLTLKGGNCPSALKNLEEALGIDPDDLEARKHIEVAEKYRARSKDRVFYAYVDRLVLRELDQE